ncbi:MAG: restriction endonuclease subunit S [Cyclobacteriaceae bacterium]|jgi:type I restriction enzyme S subunit
MKFEPFENIFRDSTSNFTKVKKEDYKIAGNYPIVDQGQAFIGGYTDDEKLVVKENLPVIIFGDHTKIFKYVDFPFTIGADGVKVLTLKNEQHNALYYYYFLKSIKIVDKGYSRHFKYLKEKKLPVTDRVSDQLHIANLLSKAENLITQRKESIALLDEFLKSTFVEMFIDKGFPYHKLGDLSTKITDGEHKKPEYKDEGMPFISVKNITNGFLDFTECKYVSVEDFNKFTKRCKPELGDIVYTKVGATYGRACVVDTEKPFCLYVSVALIKPKKELILPKFLQYAINHPFVKRQADKSIKGSGVPDLHLIEIKSFEIPLPTVELQTVFAQIVEKTEALKTQYQQSLQELENLYGSLSQRAFKGELKVREEILLSGESSQ